MSESLTSIARTAERLQVRADERRAYEDRDAMRMIEPGHRLATFAAAAVSAVVVIGSLLVLLASFRAV